MNVTKKCVISGEYGFDLNNTNKFLILEVQAKNGDTIKVNQVNGIRYKEIWMTFEYPKHEEHPITDDENKVIVVGGTQKETNRTIFIIGT